METDKHYFIEGLFIIGFSIAAAFFSVWLMSTGHRDDILYRIRFTESVSGLALGDPVQFHGVAVGTVKSIALDPADPRVVLVDVKLRNGTPVKTDTKASLKLKGITGVVNIELNGGAANAKTLLAATPDGEIPEIPSEKSALSAFLEKLPTIVEKFSSLESQAKKVVTDIGEVTNKVKENPSLLLKGPPKNNAAPSTAPAYPARTSGPH